MNYWQVGSLSGAVSVSLGAFGAHALKKVIGEDPRRLAMWSTASNYQLLHSAMTLISVMNSGHNKSPRSAVLFSVGNLLFSGSIYVLTLYPHLKFLGPVTPIGGLCYIAGWVSLYMEQ